MRKFKNAKTGIILNEDEYKALLREYFTDAWENEWCDIALEFKEDGRTLEEYLEHMVAGGLDDGYYYYD